MIQQFLCPLERDPKEAGPRKASWKLGKMQDTRYRARGEAEEMELEMVMMTKHTATRSPWLPSEVSEQPSKCFRGTRLRGAMRLHCTEPREALLRLVMQQVSRLEQHGNNADKQSTE